MAHMADPKKIKELKSKYDDLCVVCYINSTAELKTKITLGFKLLAGIYEGRINKESLSNLPKNLDINWESDIDLIIFNDNHGAIPL